MGRIAAGRRRLRRRQGTARAARVRESTARCRRTGTGDGRRPRCAPPELSRTTRSARSRSPRSSASSLLLRAGLRRRAQSRRAVAALRGLLDDQIAMAAACLDAHEATGNIVYEMMAEELRTTRCGPCGTTQAGGVLRSDRPRSARPHWAAARAGSSRSSPTARPRACCVGRGQLRRITIFVRCADRDARGHGRR